MKGLYQFISFLNEFRGQFTKLKRIWLTYIKTITKGYAYLVINTANMMSVNISSLFNYKNLMLILT